MSRDCQVSLETAAVLFIEMLLQLSTEQDRQLDRAVTACVSPLDRRPLFALREVGE